jgi:hypothetical protein
MVNTRSGYGRCVMSVIFVLLVLGTGCADGRRIFSEREPRPVELASFDAAENFRTSWTFERPPETEGSFFVEMRVVDQYFHQHLFNRHRLSYEQSGVGDLLKGTVTFNIRNSRGEVIHTVEAPLDRYTMTSPRDGVIDFMVFVYRPGEHPAIDRTLRREGSLRGSIEYTTGLTASSLQSRFIITF